MKTKKVNPHQVDAVVMAEIDRIRQCRHWVTGWWLPDYARARKNELLNKPTSKNKDIEYIERMGW